MQYRYCSRLFDENEIEQIRRICDADDLPLRAEISRRVCRQLQWLRPDGRLKDMSCRVALLRMQRDGLITLPSPANGNGNGKISVPFTKLSEPGPPIIGSASQLSDLQLQAVLSSRQSHLWNELVARYHYLGYTPLPGAQYRYLITDGNQPLGAIGFGAAAWKIAPRDRWIGWDASTRESNLMYVANNNRFLILPWVCVKNLASKILAITAKRLRTDWPRRYGHRLLLLETLVETQRYIGTSYKASNWQYLGKTKGRGKLPRPNQPPLPIKDIYTYPLVPNATQLLRHSRPHLLQ
jgi:hypothetical protein